MVSSISTYTISISADSITFTINVSPISDKTYAIKFSNEGIILSSSITSNGMVFTSSQAGNVSQYTVGIDIEL